MPVPKYTIIYYLVYYLIQSAALLAKSCKVSEMTLIKDSFHSLKNNGSSGNIKPLKKIKWQKDISPNFYVDFRWLCLSKRAGEYWVSLKYILLEENLECLHTFHSVSCL